MIASYFSLFLFCNKIYIFFPLTFFFFHYENSLYTLILSPIQNFFQKEMFAAVASHKVKEE